MMHVVSDVCAVMTCSVIRNHNKCQAIRSARTVWSHIGFAGQIERQNNLHTTTGKAEKNVIFSTPICMK